MARKTYVWRDGRLMEVRPKNRHKLYPADRAVMVNRDAIMSIPEASHVAGEMIDKMSRERGK